MCTQMMEQPILLKLPSLLAAWFFWTYQNKSHDIKILVDLIHSWSQFLTLTCLYGKMNFWRVLCVFLKYFLKNKPSPKSPFSFRIRMFFIILLIPTLWNIVKIIQNDKLVLVWAIFGIIWRKEKEVLKLYSLIAEKI